MRVFVRSPRHSGLIKVLTGIGATVFAQPRGGLSVIGIGRLPDRGGPPLITTYSSRN
ncbi:MAG: hypothetical protein ACRDTX_19405 [Pseudonocardiaceae bacterium]